MKSTTNNSTNIVTLTEQAPGEAETFSIRLKRTTGEQIITRLITSVPTPVPDPTPSPTPTPTPIPGDWVAEKPRAQVDVSYTPPTGQTWEVRSADDMHAALSGYTDGDEIVVLASIAGNFVARWPGRLIVRGPTIPPAGVRVTPTSAAGFPKLRATTASPVFAALGGGTSVRLLGLDIGAVPELITMYTMVAFGNGDETSLTALPINCVADRCLIVAHDELDVRRGVGLQGIACGVVDSWIKVQSAFDAAAIWGWNGPGPYGAYNSRLEASGENWMFGGADSQIPNNIASDITIDRCHLPKQYDAWGQPKNFGEAKCVRRLRQSRCVIDGIGTARSTQPGYALTLSATDQDRLAPWATVEDVTVEWCEYRNVLCFASLVGWYYDDQRFWTRRVSLRNTLVRPLAPGLGIGVIFQRHTENLEVDHCTMERVDYAFLFEGGAKLDGGIKGLRVTDNLARTWTPIHIPDSLAAFDQYAPGRVVEGNEFIPFNNDLPATTSKGVDRVALASALAGVVVAP